MNDAVIFRSSKFSLDPPVENGISYDLPLGDDIAAYLAERIPAEAPSCAVGSPIREDWGSVLDVSIGADAYWINVHWLPCRDVEDRWGIQFSQRLGCIAQLFGQRSSPSACRPIQTIVARIIAEAPDTFTHVEWLSDSQFQARQ